MNTLINNESGKVALISSNPVTKFLNVIRCWTDDPIKSKEIIFLAMKTHYLTYLFFLMTGVNLTICISFMLQGLGELPFSVMASFVVSYTLYKLLDDQLADFKLVNKKGKIKDLSNLKEKMDKKPLSECFKREVDCLTEKQGGRIFKGQMKVLFNKHNEE